MPVTTDRGLLHLFAPEPRTCGLVGERCSGDWLALLLEAGRHEPHDLEREEGIHLHEP